MTEKMRVECWKCGGEGRVAGVCIDGCCAEQDDPDCEYCSNVCEICDGDGAYDSDVEEGFDSGEWNNAEPGVHTR